MFPENLQSDSHPSKNFGNRRCGRILFEDQVIIVVDKNAGILSTPVTGKKKQNLLDELGHYAHGKLKITAVHRLDRDTSGVLVFAKDEATAEVLIGQFKERKPERQYVAILAGVIEPAAGRLEDRVFVDRYFNQKVARDGRIGQLAILHYQILAPMLNSCLVGITLETGRKNQIRVQFAERSHPVLGDQRYKSQQAKHDLWPHKRLALHAHKLVITHPTTGKIMEFRARLPEEFREFQLAAAQS